MNRKNITKENDKFIKRQNSLKEVFCEDKYNNLNLCYYSINIVKNEMVKAQKIDTIEKQIHLTKFCIEEGFSFYIVDISQTNTTKSQVKIALQRLEKYVIIYQGTDNLIIEKKEIEKTQIFSKETYGNLIEWQKEN
ncbi:TPA: hypothetical protein RTH14_001684 [Campylobacter jejuni]|nr:hypothetical protein [Campylobacter jejuni]HDZ5099463.1 hypothetical protein [Campylobacter jejuni]HDZ5102824.1 hypothetical protein [Campylobacter jejuni]HDZ5104491.1 hypothetical protein [Campylobacter jejuni]HDZ5109016.1 hypothetical protein [Campylobacter jejuni]